MSSVSSQPSPLLSICVPTFSRPDTLRQTLQSLVPHTEDIEIVVCDNASGAQAEKNRQVVEETLQAYACPWRYNRNNLPAGLKNVEMMVENFNVCVQQARGQYVYILHDDDALLPGGLSIILNKIRETRQEHFLYMFGVRLVNPEGKSLRVQAARQEEYLKPARALYNHLNDSSYVRWPSLVIKKAAYDRVGPFDRAMQSPTDIDMWARMFSVFGVYVVPDLIVGYTIHEQTETVKGFNADSLKILLRIFENSRKTNLLSEEVISRTRTNFICRWILAGVYRSVRKGDFAAARQIMGLFELVPANAFSLSLKWSFLRKAFGVVLLAGRLNPSAQN